MFSLFNKKYPAPTIETSMYVRKVLESSGIAPSSIICLDRTYYLISEEEILKIISESRVRNNKYRADFVDCDDFTLLMAAYFVGKASCFIARGSCDLGNHSWNTFITNDGKILHIDPQTYLSVEGIKNILSIWVR